MKSPILLIAFNRPDLTEKVFNVIREAKPQKLFFAVDGPREHKEGEAELCAQTRKIIEKVDWECEVKTLFRDKNLGCKKAVSSAISWFFDNVEQGIILEDDCLPSESFFSFCDELLEKYCNDNRVMMISGNNFLKEENFSGDDSYYFSRIFCIWGWATWKRAWEKYDINMETYSDFKNQKQFKNIFSNPLISHYWIKMLDRLKNNEIDTWDYQWFYSIWANNGLSIVPNINLVKNIGFSYSGTHTNYDSSGYSIEAKNFTGTIIHPQFIIPNKIAEEKSFVNFYNVDISKKKLFIRLLFDKKFRKIL